MKQNPKSKELEVYQLCVSGYGGSNSSWYDYSPGNFIFEHGSYKYDWRGGKINIL